MAEERPGTETMPQRGKVEEVCKKWLVHEDGVKAYQMQNEEFDFHYGLNRKNRRTVREDIPVAKVVQTEEERKQQQERYEYLQQLKRQEEDDQRVAQMVGVELDVEETQRQKRRENHDEKIAREMQEKEKKKYEKYLEKKREKHLQKQREKLEKELAQHTEEARLVLTSQDGGPGVRQLGADMEQMNLGGGQRSATSNGHARVTPSGRIEDDGDFSDFYAIPNDGTVDPESHKMMQEHQDEELARLLQDQEHKRTKAEVDKHKLRQIEHQDEQLARVIQEQEKLKAKKVKQRRQQLREQQRQQQMAQEAMAQGMDMSSAMESVNPAELNGQGPGHRYRRDSYTRSISNSTPESVHHQAVARQTSSPPSLPPRAPPSYETHKRLQEQNARVLGRIPPGEISQTDVGEVERWLAGTSPQHVPHYQRGNHGNRLSDDHMPPSPSPPGSYHSEEDGSRSFSPDRSVGSSQGQQQFNIAAAIDPTYRRRQHEIQSLDQTDVKTQIPLSRSLPLSEDVDLEWDPGLRGSLRRPKGHWNAMTGHYTDSTTGTMSTLGRMDEEPGPDGPVMSPFQPVQGQKRSTLDKTGRKQKSVSKKDSKGNCKQQ